MAFAEEGEHVVFAHAEKFDVAHDDHIVGFGFEQRAVDHLLQRLTVAAGQELQAFLDPLRSVEQPFAFRVLADFN